MTISGKRRLESVEHSPAAEVIGGNEDLVTGILLRLPIKSLSRFESVSKKWLSFISDPYFAQSYTRRCNPNFEPSGLLLNHHSARFQFVPFNDDGDEARVRLSYPNDPAIKIIQSCNGLLMCYSSIFSFWRAKNYGDKYYICNPTTKRFTTIRFPNPRFEADVLSVNLAFDPLKSPHYKLVCIRKVHKQTRTYRIDIFSSETRSWRRPISGFPVIFIAPYGFGINDPVYCNGAIHWFSKQETSVYFDTHTECLKTMPMLPLNHYFRYFGQSRGHLHLIVIDRPSSTEFDIWELKTDYSGWFIKYHVNLDAVFVSFPDITRNRDKRIDAFSILCVARAEKEEESTIVLFLSGKAISFNLSDKTSKKLCDLVPCRKVAALALDYEWYDAYQYIETLFRV